MTIAACRGTNVAVVALANKLVRIAWAVLARDRTYHQASTPSSRSGLTLFRGYPPAIA
jgi:hypothetical protein